VAQLAINGRRVIPRLQHLWRSVAPGLIRSRSDPRQMVFFGSRRKHALEGFNDPGPFSLLSEH
jgi:hypothetical protein